MQVDPFEPMNDSVLTTSGVQHYTAATRLLRRAVLNRLDRLSQCCLIIHDRMGRHILGDINSTLRAEIVVHDAHFYRLVALGGALGAGEAYCRGHWHSPELVMVIRALARNREALVQMGRGPARPVNALWRLWYGLRQNTRSGSRRNIAAHYDLSNPFFALFLDKQLLYSSALFEHDDQSLEQAQVAKMERICRKLDLQPGMRVMEIGTGWGGFAIYAARQYGCHVTTTTISQAQFEVASQRVAEAGLQERVHLLREDYRDLSGRYDRVVSIEMVEAVGDRYLDGYLRQVSRLLKDDGMALIQAITIEDYRYRQALKRVDFIKRYIFPGSFIPSLARLTGAAQSTDMVVRDVFDMGYSYALTLREWRRRFLNRLDEVKALGFDDRFVRMWDFYLCYCEGGFAEQAISDVQILWSKPQARWQGVNVTALPQ